MSADIFAQLITMSRTLGDPQNDYVILGEGNTSARAGNHSFWVKASGLHLHNIQPENFVQVDMEAALVMLTGPDLDDVQTREALIAAKVDPNAPGHPSVETTFHAACLQLPDVNFVGHTHPTAINALSCSTFFEAAVAGLLFPYEIVMGGIAPLLIPYVDPGLLLAREIQRRIFEYIDAYGERPKVILMQNHGLITLGDTAQKVIDITAMAIKTVRILAGTYAFGGPRFMTPAAVERINTRPDEHYRQKIISAAKSK